MGGQRNEIINKDERGIKLPNKFGVGVQHGPPQSPGFFFFNVQLKH